MEKYCPHCNRITDRFWKNASRYDGLSNYCIDCFTEYRNENPDISLRSRATFKMKHPEYMSEYGKNWRNAKKQETIKTLSQS